MRSIGIRTHGSKHHCSVWRVHSQSKFAPPSLLGSTSRMVDFECEITERLHVRSIFLQNIHRKRQQVTLEKMRSSFNVIDEDLVTSNEIESHLKKAFKKNKFVYPSDIAFELGIEYETVRNIIDKMVKEGKLER